MKYQKAQYWQKYADLYVLPRFKKKLGEKRKTCFIFQAFYLSVVCGFFVFVCCFFLQAIRKVVINHSQVSQNEAHRTMGMWKVDIVSGITIPTFPNWRFPFYQNGKYMVYARFKTYDFCYNNSDFWQNYKKLRIPRFWLIPHISTLSKNTLIFIGMTSWFNSSLCEAIFYICTWILEDILSTPERVTNANCCRLTYLAGWHLENCRTAAIPTM